MIITTFCRIISVKLSFNDFYEKPRNGVFGIMGNKEASLKIGGRIEVICGSMFSGKSEELIRRIKRLLIAKQKVQAFKPCIDDRFSHTHITTHNGTKINAVPIETPNHIMTLLLPDIQAVAIDEAQFFDNCIIDVCEQLANKGIKVIAAGLDLDYMGKPFGPMPQLMAIAESVTKLKAVCSFCGNDADRTILDKPNEAHLQIKDNPIIIGAMDKGYKPVCRQCFCKYNTFITI